MSDAMPPMLPAEETMHGTLGIEVVEQAGDLVRGRIPVTGRVRQPFGPVHGGAMLTLIESLTSLGTANAVVPEGMVALGQEVSASFLRPIMDGHVNGAARVRRRGRSAWVWEVEITDDEGRLCALGRATIAVRERPPASPGTGS